MTKKEFLKNLGKKLSMLEKKDRDETLSYYSELIDDKIESGTPEEKAIEELGDIDKIAEQIIADAKETGKLKKEAPVLNIALIVLGAPLWIPLIVTIGAVLFTLYCVVWSLVIAMWAVVIALSASGICCIIGGFVLLFVNPSQTLLAEGIGLVSMSSALLLFIPVLKFTKLLVKSSIAFIVKVFTKIKSLFYKER